MSLITCKSGKSYILLVQSKFSLKFYKYFADSNNRNNKNPNIRTLAYYQNQTYLLPTHGNTM